MNAIRASFAIYIDELEVDELVDKVLTIANS
jgi:selenocysteine lyase/cysteine desulfurase